MHYRFYLGIGLIFTIILVQSQPLVGGFGAPIFFTQYDKTKINEIKQVKNIDHIEIIYQANKPHLANLANTITQNLPNYKIILKTVDLHDTATTKYNTSAVIVILYFIPGSAPAKKNSHLKVGAF